MRTSRTYCTPLMVALMRVRYLPRLVVSCACIRCALFGYGRGAGSSSDPILLAAYGTVERV